MGARLAPGRPERPPAPRVGGAGPPHGGRTLTAASRWASAEEIAAAVRSRTLRAVDVVSTALDRIERADPALCAFVEVWGEEAVRRAAEVDARIDGGPPCASGAGSLGAGEWLPLAGVPIAVKGRHGLRTAGPLLAAGCVAVGATSVPGPGTAWQTWGLGAHGRTVNPWRADRTAGGSSAGSAAAVAAGLVPLATGSDGAGSVRIPAAWCGVVGLKVTGGLLPSADRTGLAAPGVLTRSASDAAAWWRAVSQESAPVSARLPVTAVLSPDLGFADPDPEPVELARAAALRLADAGVVRLVRPRTPLRLEDPASGWLALRTSGADLADAHRVRAKNDRRLERLFADAQLLLTPTTPTAPHGHDGPGDRYSTALTWAFNLSGHPALSLPVDFGTDGCPVGLQLVAPHGREALLLAVAREAEAHTAPWPDAPRSMP